MSYSGSRFDKQLSRSVTIIATGSTLPASPFSSQADIEDLAAEFRNGGGSLYPDAEAADPDTGDLFLYYGFGSYGNNGYG